MFMFLLELTINISGLNLKRTTLERNFCLNISENLERDHAREFVRGTLVSATQVSATLRPVMRVKSCDLRTKVNGPSGVFRAWRVARLAARARVSRMRAHKYLRYFRQSFLRKLVMTTAKTKCVSKVVCQVCGRLRFAAWVRLN
jgi:hypothetical protein